MKKWGIVFAGLLVAFVFLSVIDVSGIIGDSGTISIEILPNVFKIIVHHPEEATTYTFANGDTYDLGLNVSANAPAENWVYTLFEPERVRAGPTILGGNPIGDPTAFLPNVTITAVRWENELNVSADAVSGGGKDNESFIFDIFVPNTAPALFGIDTQIFECEGTSDDFGFLSLPFSAEDIDEMDLFFGIDSQAVGVSFFLDQNPTQTITTYLTHRESILKSSNFYEHPGVYSMSVSVGENPLEPPLSDTGEDALSARVDTSLIVIEINSPPVINNSLKVQTLWNNGENTTLVHDFNATDDESGDEITGTLNFNISFDSSPDLFGIDSVGAVDFDAMDLPVGNFVVNVCVTDEALPVGNRHPDIFRYCEQDGLNQTTCNEFQLTITDENRPPEIVNFYPLSLGFSAGGKDSLLFNVTEHDPDGTIPDAYWYVDDVFEEFDTLSLIDEFEFSFDCGVSGLHFVRVDVTDGELNVSIQWEVDVQNVACPVPPPGGGGGGGGGRGSICRPSWACGNWRTCQDVDSGLVSGALSGENYREVQEQCEKEGSRGDFCGYQARNCLDVKTCDSSYNKPNEFQGCYFTENPSCSDGIKNCHSDSCEFLVDCGGPCGACATCSDGIQNQGEQGVDCGSPCANECPAEIPQRQNVSVYLWGLLGIGILAIAIWAYTIWRKKKLLETPQKNINKSRGLA